MIYPPTQANIEKAGTYIREGGIVAFPTETVYGLGASAFNEAAVKRIFELKSRPAFDPLIVHIWPASEIGLVADPQSNPLIASRLARLGMFWPGPLSLVLPKHPMLPRIVTGGKNSVAVRVPGHPVALALLRACGMPVAAPSANPFSAVSPTSAQHVEEAFGDRIDMILDGGPCKIGIESTVVSLLEEKIRILRPGAVTEEQLLEVFSRDQICCVRVDCKEQDTAEIRSPGMLSRHYAPKTPIALKGSIDMDQLPTRVGLIKFKEDRDTSNKMDFCVTSTLSKTGDPKEVAARLFATLRNLDKQGLNLILVDCCAEEGLGRAIMDRLRRAASPKK